MTRFGKILVFLNVAVSLLLAAWAFDIYANGVDWSDRKGKPGERGGELALREARLEELWKSLPPAEASWLTARRQVVDVEAHLAADREWYAREIHHVFVTAGTNEDPTAIGRIVYAPDEGQGVRKGQILLDAKGFPQLQPIRDDKGNALELRSLAVYNKNDEAVLHSIEQTIAAHEKQIHEANALTDQIIGDKAKGKRGLQQRIRDEEVKLAELLVEQRTLEEPLVNAAVEGQTLLQRRAQLERRIDELKKIGVASGK